MRNRPWTTLEIRRLVQLRQQGLSIPQIARQMDRSYYSVQMQCTHSQVPKKLRREKIWELVRVPHRKREVARQLGISISRVNVAKWQLRKLGFRVAETIL